MKTLKAIAVAATLILAPVQVPAADYEVQNVMDDALYGAGVGAMVGLGMLLLSDVPSDNFSYISRGAGIGIIAGAAYGVFRSSRSFAQLEGGEIYLGVPSPEFALRQTAAGLDLVMKTDLIRGSF